ncbi:MAG TPA: phosphate ABC transporter substrate-binding protein PstS [Chloroflexi bacterium]|nr:phosphate ABC transporter substrate-binding protein PstS [Chloroflexota bacterium]
MKGALDLYKRILASGALAVLCAASLMTASQATPARASVSLTGAGSSFDFPFFDKAFSVYQSSHSVSINYQPIGSGAGIQQFTAKTVDFGASDVPMNPVSELPAAVKAGGAVLQIPVALGGVSVAYNVPGVKTGLHLNGTVLAKIFLGTISKWNDRAIKALNKKVSLPDTQITVVHRSDGSGTSYIFTDYLSKVSDQWRGLAGTGKLPNWPTGIGEKGNPGVADLIRSTPGTIGYVELAYVIQTHMHQAMLENRKHNFLVPNLKTVAAAAASFPKVTSEKFSIVNGSGKNAYPIAGYSWALVFKHQTDSTKGKALVNLMKWTVTTGQKYAKNLQYVPLPSGVQKLGTSLLKTATF